MDNKVLLCAIAKQENLYIREWVEYHLKLGFDHITIYDNNEPDGERISDVVGGYPNVNIIDFRGRHQKSCETQVAAYNACYKGAGAYDWVMFMDIDEFLWFRDYDNIKSFLEQNWIRKANVIRFHWKCYSDNGKLTYEDLPVMKRFTEECKEKSVNYHMKQLYRTKLGTLRIVNVHYTNHVNNIYYPDGKPAPYITTTKDRNVHDELAHVKHYVTKSLEEYVKIKYARRGVGSSKTRLNLDFYFKYNEKTDEKLKYYKTLTNELNNGTSIEIKPKPMPYIPETKLNESKRFEPQAYYEDKFCPGAPKKQENRKTEEANPACGKNAGVNTCDNKTPVKKEDGKPPASENVGDGVSVCITAYNAQDFIEECLDSVASQTWLKTHENWEIIVGIDGCEKTLAKMKEIMYKYENLRVLMMYSNKGTYVTSNTIMKEARYKWLIRFDSDDIMHDNMIETLFKNKKDYDIVRFKSIDFPVKKTRISFGQIMINKNVFVKYGGYMAWSCAADTELLTRLSDRVKIGVVDSIVFSRRIHESSLIHSPLTCHSSDIRKKYVEYINSKSKSEPYIKMVVNIFKEIKKERIIVTMTSWEKRIQYVPNTIRCILENTYKPHEIIVNLSTDEFPNKEEELPCDLVAYAKEGRIRINWVKENTKAYKKIMPVLDMYPDDVIICVDDDMDYPSDFIEKLYTTYAKYNCKCPITCGNYKWEGGIYSHAGAYSLIKKEFFGKYLYELYDNVVMKKGIDKMPFSDPVYTYSALLNGVKYRKADDINMQEYVRKSSVGKISPISNTGEKYYKNNITLEHDILKKHINETYGKNYTQLLNIPIIVSFTTWTKRIESAVKMLTHFKKQTLKPDKIICWLSSDEFGGENTPEELKPFENTGFIEIRWVAKNTYCHKRYEVFKEYNDCYVILIDDDIYYDENYVKEIVEFAYKNSNYIVNYYANMETYTGCVNKSVKFVDYPTLKNTFLSGMCCFPPYTFPMESFKYENDRDRLTKNCDDSWIKAWIIKTNTRLIGMHEWKRVPNPIENTREVSIYKENSKIVKGVKIKVSKFAKCIKLLGIEEQVKKLFPEFDIDTASKLDVDTIMMKEKIMNRAKQKGFNINLDNPKTWCEKLQWMQIYDDKNELKTKCADKLLLHEYSVEKLGKDICVPVIKVYDSPDDIDFSKLPNEFVLKCNHGYNFNILCKDKSMLSENECISDIKKWLSTPFGESNMQPHYLGIERKCYAEKMLHNEGKQEVTDYKFVCFNGNPTYLQILNDRHTKDFHLNYYDMDGKFVNICRIDVPCNPSKLDDMPVNFDLMKKYAAKLSEDFKFVRVDFYEENGVVYLGELTFTPATGYIRWTDPNIDRMFGDMIEL